LWRTLTLARSPGDGPPPIFRTRIKRLLDLDRELDAGGLEVPSPSTFAFIAPAEGGSGIEARYAPFDAFCLAIALDLLDLLIDDANGIIAGHGRVLAAKLIGLDQVPCLRLSHLTETEARLCARRQQARLERRLGQGAADNRAAGPDRGRLPGRDDRFLDRRGRRRPAGGA